jgi:hypothetical protein
MSAMTPDDASQWVTITTKVVDDPKVGNSKRQAKTGLAASMAVDLLLGQHRAGKPWALRILRALAIRGAQPEFAALVKAGERITIDYEGRRVTASGIVGIRNAAGGFQQSLFVDLSPAEARAYVDMLRRQRNTLSDDILVYEQGLALLDQCPEAASIRDAAKRLGVVLPGSAQTA